VLRYAWLWLCAGVSETASEDRGDEGMDVRCESMTDLYPQTLLFALHTDSGNSLRIFFQCFSSLTGSRKT
jgi:hypothetical protein